MEKSIVRGLMSAAVFAMATTAQSASVTPVFTDEGLVTTGGATSTRVFSADLTGLGISEIAAITVTDSNSGVGGSPGIYSGFDLDAIFLDLDGMLSTTADRVFADSFLFNVGTIRGGGSPVSPSGGPTNGSSSATTVDEAFATLDAIDGIFFGAGSLSLGDGGSLTAIFDPGVPVGSTLFLFAGEVSGSAGEDITGLVEISDLSLIHI